MRLTVLGCSGTFPGPDSPCSSYLVEHDGYRLVLGLGAGSLGALQRHCGLLDVDAVYITHLHADHCIDLLAYSHARRYHPAGVPPVLPVHGPAGLRERIAVSYETPPTDGLLDVYDVRELGAGTITLGSFTVTRKVVRHHGECHSLRLEAGGRVLTFSADTATGVQRLLLTHLVPFHDPEVTLAEALSTWAGPLELARSGASYGV